MVDNIAALQKYVSELPMMNVLVLGIIEFFPAYSLVVYELRHRSYRWGRRPRPIISSHSSNPDDTYQCKS